MMGKNGDEVQSKRTRVMLNTTYITCIAYS